MHELQEVPVMLLRSVAVDAYLIMYGNNAREMVCCLVHVHLKDVLRHLQAEKHVQEPTPAMLHIEGGQV